MNRLVVTLLSAGVFTSLVTGIFSLIITMKNNSAIKELEKEKIGYQKQEQLYKTVHLAREELLKALPAQKQIRVSSTSLESIIKDNTDVVDKLEELVSACLNSQNIIWVHFNKYSPYFSKNESEVFDGMNSKLVKLFKEKNDLLDQISHIKTTNPDILKQLEEQPNEHTNDTVKRARKLGNRYSPLLLDIIAATVELEDWYFELLEKYIRSYIK